MKKYLLVIQLPIASMGDFDRLVAAEDRMGEALKGVAEVDGHDAGSGEGNIFIHTDTPESDVQTALQCLEEHVREEAKAACREIEGNTYTILWPPGLKEFRVL
jgi:hypothetical protein